MKVLIATHNPGKSREIRAMLDGLNWDFVTLSDLSITQQAPEEELTYMGNALSKARFYAALSGLPVLADDSGLEVSALPTTLGVWTRRFGAGPHASDREWLDVFLQAIENAEDRSARFVCGAVFIDASGREFTAEACVEGQLLRAPVTAIEPGIPLSSVFMPHGAERVFSAMEVDEKNRYSHRGLAFASLKNQLLSAL